ncbi:MAG TPA: MerR family transcriptional regulator [Mycobacteriales bacterium]|nr:MerR family transcriptional regulator [Mycobacteriales bacterium]
MARKVAEITPATLTIDELAARVGMTVRNVRAHQSRGLLPPPQVRGRTGYYDDSHVARLELVKDMQAEGFNLRAIQHALDQVAPGTDRAVLAFRRRLLEPWSDEPPEILDRAAIAELFGTFDEKYVARAVKLGALVPLSADRFEAPSPSLLRAGAEVIALGVPLPAVLELQSVIHRHADAVAKSFVDLFLEHVWRPFVAAGRPEEQWADVVAALERVQPLAGQALLATLRLSMEKRSAAALEYELHH